MQEATEPAPRQPSKLITCILPDDGSHKLLIEALRERDITRAEVVSCLGMSSLVDANIKPGTLPDTFLARMVTVVVPASKADTLFPFIYEKARVDRDGGGIVLQTALATATPYTLPIGVAEEEDQD